MGPGWGRIYWPIWLIVTFVTFMGPEFIAIFTDPKNTFSDYVWYELKVARTPISIFDWSAIHILIFGMWCVVLVWATIHLFFRKWI